MGNKANQAKQLLESKLLAELFEEYDQRLYNEWRRDGLTVEQAETARARASGLQGFYLWLKNKCEGIASE